MLPLLASVLVASAAGFGGGYMVRHLISEHRRRETSRRYALGLASR